MNRSAAECTASDKTLTEPETSQTASFAITSSALVVNGSRSARKRASPACAMTSALVVGFGFAGGVAILGLREHAAVVRSRPVGALQALALAPIAGRRRDGPFWFRRNLARRRRRGSRSGDGCAFGGDGGRALRRAPAQVEVL